MPQGSEQSQNPMMQEIARHDHLCLVYETEAEILAPVIPFIQNGVALGERCIYLSADQGMLERVLKTAFEGQENDRGALKLLSARESWLNGGSFDAARVLGLLESLSSGSRADGFNGSRIICDMRWAGRQAQQASLLSEMEQGLNRFAERHEVTLLCLYHRGSFTAESALELARLHPHLVIGDRVCRNSFFRAADGAAALPRGNSELDLFLSALHANATAVADRDRLRQELEQAYAALARKIYEHWQEEDSLRASEKELHQKDEALLEHRRRLQTILQHLPTMLMAFDAGHRLTSCNHEFERVSGFRAEEVMGKLMLDLIEVHDEGREELLGAHPPEGGNYRGREWKIRCKDGSLRSASWSNISRFVPIPGWPNWIMGLDQTPGLQVGPGLGSVTGQAGNRAGERDGFPGPVSDDPGGQLAQPGACRAFADKGASREQVASELPQGRDCRGQDS